MLTTLTALFLAALALGCLLFSRMATCQDTQAVHIVPRVRIRPADSALLAGLSATKTFKSNVDLVLVPVTVTDPMNRLVTGLEKGNFAVYQDKKREQTRNLWSDDVPISVGIIWDVSGSMGDKMPNARDGIRAFLETGNPHASSSSSHFLTGRSWFQTSPATLVILKASLCFREPTVKRACWMQST